MSGRGMRVEGTVAPGFEPVRQAFEHGMNTMAEEHAQLCVYHKGERVVDLDRPMPQAGHARVVAELGPGDGARDGPGRRGEDHSWLPGVQVDESGIERLLHTNGHAAQSSRDWASIKGAPSILGAGRDKRNVLREIEVVEHVGVQATIVQHRQNDGTVMIVIFQNCGFG